jgi:hypothetical protein
MLSLERGIAHFSSYLLVLKGDVSTAPPTGCHLTCFSLRFSRVVHDSINALCILRLRQLRLLHLAGISITKANIRIFYLVPVIIEFRVRVKYRVGYRE